MPTCSSCHRINLKRSDFTTSQLKKKSHERRCKRCLEREANSESFPPDSSLPLVLESPPHGVSSANDNLQHDHEERSEEFNYDAPAEPSNLNEVQVDRLIQSAEYAQQALEDMLGELHQDLSRDELERQESKESAESDVATTELSERAAARHEPYERIIADGILASMSGNDSPDVIDRLDETPSGVSDGDTSLLEPSPWQSPLVKLGGSFSESPVLLVMSTTNNESDIALLDEGKRLLEAEKMTCAVAMESSDASLFEKLVSGHDDRQQPLVFCLFNDHAQFFCGMRQLELYSNNSELSAKLSDFRAKLEELVLALGGSNTMLEEGTEKEHLSVDDNKEIEPASLAFQSTDFQAGTFEAEADADFIQEATRAFEHQNSENPATIHECSDDQGEHPETSFDSFASAIENETDMDVPYTRNLPVGDGIGSAAGDEIFPATDDISFTKAGLLLTRPHDSVLHDKRLKNSENQYSLVDVATGLPCSTKADRPVGGDAVLLNSNVQIIDGDDYKISRLVSLDNSEMAQSASNDDEDFGVTNSSEHAEEHFSDQGERQCRSHVKEERNFPLLTPAKSHGTLLNGSKHTDAQSFADEADLAPKTEETMPYQAKTSGPFEASDKVIDQDAKTQHGSALSFAEDENDICLVKHRETQTVSSTEEIVSLIDEVTTTGEVDVVEEPLTTCLESSHTPSNASVDDSIDDSTVVARADSGQNSEALERTANGAQLIIPVETSSDSLVGNGMNFNLSSMSRFSNELAVPLNLTSFEGDSAPNGNKPKLSAYLDATLRANTASMKASAEPIKLNTGASKLKRMYLDAVAPKEGDLQENNKPVILDIDISAQKEKYNESLSRKFDITRHADDLELGNFCRSKEAYLAQANGSFDQDKKSFLLGEKKDGGPEPSSFGSNASLSRRFDDYERDNGARTAQVRGTFDPLVAKAGVEEYAVDRMTNDREPTDEINVLAAEARVPCEAGIRNRLDMAETLGLHESGKRALYEARINEQLQREPREQYAEESIRRTLRREQEKKRLLDEIEEIRRRIRGKLEAQAVNDGLALINTKENLPNEFRSLQNDIALAETEVGVEENVDSSVCKASPETGAVTTVVFRDSGLPKAAQGSRDEPGASILASARGDDGGNEVEAPVGAASEASPETGAVTTEVFRDSGLPKAAQGSSDEADTLDNYQQIIKSGAKIDKWAPNVATGYPDPVEGQSESPFIVCESSARDKESTLDFIADSSNRTEQCVLSPVEMDVAMQRSATASFGGTTSAQSSVSTEVASNIKKETPSTESVSDNMTETSDIDAEVVLRELLTSRALPPINQSLPVAEKAQAEGNLQDQPPYREPASLFVDRSDDKRTSLRVSHEPEPMKICLQENERDKIKADDYLPAESIQYPMYMEDSKDIEAGFADETGSKTYSSEPSGALTPKRIGWSRRTKILFAAFFLLLLLMIGLLVGFSRRNKAADEDSHTNPAPSTKPPKETQTEPPTGSPSLVDDMDLFLNSLPEYSRAAINVADSPQQLAFNWLTTEDAFQANDSQKRLVRFALASFYYATGGDDWTNNTGWLTGVDVCEWFTNSPSNCLGTEFSYLQFRANNLAGTIPMEIGLISNLFTFQVEGNPKLQGTLPATIADLTQLYWLILNENGLSGSLPASLGSINSLLFLELEQNQLSGTIPSELQGLSLLNRLSLRNNNLSGNIPLELNSLAGLRFFDLSENRLQGLLPRSLIRNMTELRYFSVGGNQLTGDTLSRGRQLWTSLATTEIIIFGSNLFAGSLPGALISESLGRVIDLDLSDNGLTGTIPSELGLLPVSLVNLSLQRNALTGSVPEEVCSLVETRGLVLTIDCEAVQCDCNCACGL